MKLKRILLFVTFSFIWLPSVQAYPWMFFRQDKSQGSVELNTHISYFVKGQATVFSGAAANYHHPTIDINLGYDYSFAEKKHYFRLSELAVIFPFLSKEWKMSIGFKDVLWSEADRYWNYGLWQPRYMLDAFRPIQMGLPGLYLDYEGDTSFLFLISYFALPDITVFPQIRREKISSKNPFFIDSTIDIQWDIDQPDFFQIKRFLKPVIAFQIKHFLKNSHFSFSYAYKPVNQFQYFGQLKAINLSDNRKSDITIKDFNYSVLSHHLVSLEGDTSLSKNLSLFTSLFYENPGKKTYGQNWLSDRFESHMTGSLLLYFQENLGEESKTLFTLGYTKTIEDRSYKQISNVVTEDFEQVLNRDFNWKEAVSASIEYQNKKLFQGFLFRFRANYALDNGLYALALEQYFNCTPHIQIYLSGDVLFRFSDNYLEPGSSSIKKYRELSRLVAGGKYVF